MFKSCGLPREFAAQHHRHCHHEAGVIEFIDGTGSNFYRIHERVIRSHLGSYRPVGFCSY